MPPAQNNAGAPEGNDFRGDGAPDSDAANDDDGVIITPPGSRASSPPPAASADDVVREFADCGFKEMSASIVARIIDLCSQYKISALEISSAYFAFLIRNKVELSSVEAEPSITMLRNFERQYLSKRKNRAAPRPAPASRPTPPRSTREGANDGEQGEGTSAAAGPTDQLTRGSDDEESEEEDRDTSAAPRSRRGRQKRGASSRSAAALLQGSKTKPSLRLQQEDEIAQRKKESEVKY